MLENNKIQQLYLILNSQVYFEKMKTKKSQRE